ncbi:3-oxoacyl-ACP synthase [Tamlana sp. 2201CG12-4]|uniref:3-oxoacyl-ACP synthase n=1 Tax=Tamlana sp. 2201CG12-4 TaxID=3112582 RepID=UPI002DBAB92F|nr:3-oxoacyl-ACP synthase [Tamlana sp. 2201CG12-4]MEC3906195.1 3-oxoacyl-ACP synthase [Tamlana sp. 2201CG12-4]
MEENLKIKAQLYTLCQEFIEERFWAIQKTIDEIQLSLTSETKSSVGDKHETGRAMLQLEREKAGNQLAEIQKTKAVLLKVNSAVSSKHIGLGSVVYTSNANYFIAISAGELKVNDTAFYAISPHTPMGQLLLGKKVGDALTFRSKPFVIQDVL